ncbi:sodium ion-translocating decarboxylase subunit beta [Opitutus terrae]|uniref:Sodium ion-translocating decarboxylase, beta subunit n=1 Tax=Opitutus terrae (strain DSM 11246 / JCM 15787 / PB90-1) TaxID=452637 RepID=B1ZTD9_OPITP|nr:sodium ion-translocating decarboxylase subunit beta [Opitutus terrae]ACB76593.1 sodium ion-translocating decarboxylase, beta subunit [Opitutus terrae PB90-1]
MLDGLLSFFQTTGFQAITWQMLVMWAIAAALLYLAIAKGFEPLLLVPIAFGALVANLPTRGVITTDRLADGTSQSAVFRIEAQVLPEPTSPPATDESSEKLKLRVERVEGGLYDFISQGVKLELFPPLIFLGVGALTDFGPLIAMPRTLLLGAAAQLGLFITFMGANLLGFTSKQSASIGIIGGADGPTAIFLSNKLAPELLGAIAVAAYSYMSLVPLIQPPIMRLLTTKKERVIRMKSLRKVSKLEKLVFAIVVMIICILLVPDASALIAMLMLGNFLRECGATERLVKSAQNEIINVLTIFLGTSVGLTMQAETFLAPATIKIIVLGVVAFGFSTAGGILGAKIMNWLSPHNPVNPLIGSAGVSAVPMAARVSHNEGQRYDSSNYLLMHAMGPNVAGVIGTAVAAGYFISTLGH